MTQFKRHSSTFIFDPLYNPMRSFQALYFEMLIVARVTSSCSHIRRCWRVRNSKKCNYTQFQGVHPTQLILAYYHYSIKNRSRADVQKFVNSFFFLSLFVFVFVFCFCFCFVVLLLLLFGFLCLNIHSVKLQTQAR